MGYISPSFVKEFNYSYKSELNLAMSITEEIANQAKNANLDALSKKSPGLKNFDWENYLFLSSIRLTKLALELKQLLPLRKKVLDVGSYFGNFSIFLKKLGYEVVAIDNYIEFGSALEWAKENLQKNDIKVLDFSKTGSNLEAIAKESFDAILSMGVIEHIPFTPRFHLEGINRALKTKGLLALETPNIAYLYKRLALNKGDSIFCPVETQYYTEIPFEGHNREYNQKEVHWMLSTLNHKVEKSILYNFSLYGLKSISDSELENLQKMEYDQTLKEIILTISRKN